MMNFYITYTLDDIGPMEDNRVGQFRSSTVRQITIIIAIPQMIPLPKNFLNEKKLRTFRFTVNFLPFIIRTKYGDQVTPAGWILSTDLGNSIL